MMRRTLLFALVAAGSILAQAGCKNSCPNTPAGAPPGVIFTPDPGAAAGAAPMPQGSPWLPEPPIAPAPIGTQSKSPDPYGYQKDSSGQTGGPPTVRLYPPEVVENPDSGKKTQLRPPEVSGSDKPAPPRVENGPTHKEPPLLPVGIPQFALVRNNLANGLRPSLDDGLSWLKTNGYKTVLYLHEPGVPDSADRQQVEKRGLKFMALEVSALSLSQKTIDDFNRIVGDSAGLPLFVYDTDGSLAGGLWYLHFRLTQGATEETARNQAHPLGLRENREGGHRQMWQAVQKFMSDRQP